VIFGSAARSRREYSRVRPQAQHWQYLTVPSFLRPVLARQRPPLRIVMRYCWTPVCHAT
jgi:hypothetical protein